MSTLVSPISFPSWRRLYGAVVGGLVAGLVLAVWLEAGEAVTRIPSQLTQIERHITSWFGPAQLLDAPKITFEEEYLGIVGHLLLSAAAGAAFAMVWRRDRSIIIDGLLFGAAFFVVAHAIVGPLLGLTPGMWNFPLSIFLTGCIINGFFGICTAFFAREFEYRKKRSRPL